MSDNKALKKLLKSRLIEVDKCRKTHVDNQRGIVSGLTKVGKTPKEAWDIFYTQLTEYFKEMALTSELLARLERD
jgi:hypothetical protein